MIGEGFLVIGIDGAVGVDGEEDGAFEAVALAENFGQHGEAFFAAVFFVATEEDDVFAVAGAVFGGIDDGGLRGTRESAEAKQEEQSEKNSTGRNVDVGHGSLVGMCDSNSPAPRVQELVISTSGEGSRLGNLQQAEVRIEKTECG